MLFRSGVGGGGEDGKLLYDMVREICPTHFLPDNIIKRIGDER